MRNYSFCIFLLILIGCSSDNIDERNTLKSYLVSKEVVLDNVIACAASNTNDELVSVFFYPREGASNIQYFETESVDVDKNDYENYSLVTYGLQDVFNGYLKRFQVDVSNEKWVIVSFDEDEKTHLSNPIRLKQMSKPTEYLPQNIEVDAASQMPIFTWQDGQYDDSAIYFQVVSNAANSLLSGTYTYDKNFTFYDLQNVVLNITSVSPPALNENEVYTFTLMGVSEDNWVNQFSIIDFQLD